MKKTAIKYGSVWSGVGGSIGLFLFIMVLFFFLAPDWFVEASDRILTVWERMVAPLTKCNAPIPEAS